MQTEAYNKNPQIKFMDIDPKSKQSIEDDSQTSPPQIDQSEISMTYSNTNKT